MALALLGTNSTKELKLNAVVSTRNVVMGGIAAFTSFVVLILVATTTNLKKSTKIILLNLLVSDMVVMIHGVIYGKLVQNEVDAADHVCGISVFILINGFFLSHAAVAWISLNNFIAVFHPFKHRVLITTKSVSIAVTTTWILLCILGSTAVIGHSTPPSGPCVTLAYIPKYSAVLVFFVMFIFDVSVIAMNVSLCIGLRKKRRVTIGIESRNNRNNANCHLAEISGHKRRFGIEAPGEMQTLPPIPSRKQHDLINDTNRSKTLHENGNKYTGSLLENTTSGVAPSDKVESVEMQTSHTDHRYDLSFKRKEGSSSSSTGDVTPNSSGMGGCFPLAETFPEFDTHFQGNHFRFIKNRSDFDINKANRLMGDEREISSLREIPVDLSDKPSIETKQSCFSIMKSKAVIRPALPRRVGQIADARRNQFHRLSVSMMIISFWCCVFNVPCDLFLFYMAFLAEDRLQANFSPMGIIATTLLVINVFGDPFIYAWRFLPWKNLLKNLRQFCCE